MTKTKPNNAKPAFATWYAAAATVAAGLAVARADAQRRPL